MTTIREVDIQSINETFGEKKEKNRDKGLLKEEKEKKKDKYNKNKDSGRIKVKLHSDPKEKVEVESAVVVESPVVESVVDSSVVESQVEIKLASGEAVSEDLPKQVRQKTFIVSSSKISDFNQKRTGRVPSKEEFADNLQYTKPCQFCVRKKGEDKDDEWGVCYREVCTYAHCLQELQIPTCSFRDRCMKKDGSLDKRTGKVDGNKKFRCQFKHPGETNDEYYDRTGIEKPNLPETSEKTRQPRKEKSPVSQEKAQEKRQEKFREKRHDKAQEKYEDKVQSETTIIQVPRVMQREALELCLMKNLKNFKIILTD